MRDEYSYQRAEMFNFIPFRVISFASDASIWGMFDWFGGNEIFDDLYSYNGFITEC